VSVRLYPERVVIVADQDVVAEHPRAVDRDQVSNENGFRIRSTLLDGLTARARTRRRLTPVWLYYWYEDGCLATRSGVPRSRRLRKANAEVAKPVVCGGSG
jgi:hypothetical protein